MKKRLLMTALLLALLLMGCSKKETDATLENRIEDNQLEADAGELTEDILEDISEDTVEFDDITDPLDDVTEDSEDSEVYEEAVESAAYMSFKTEMGQIGYRGSVDNADWLYCYTLFGYHDGDGFIVDKMYYQYVQNNEYDFYQQEVIYFDGSLTIKDDYKLIAQTDDYSIYQDGEENYYAQIPSFNNMVIRGSVEENQIQAFLRSYSYEADDNSKDLFKNVVFGDYKFADKMQLSAYPESV